MTASNLQMGSGLRLLNSTPTQGLASDTRSVDALRSTAARDPKAAIKDTAKQFEALFMQELMKSMRQANVSSGMLDNAGSKMGTDMLDTQYANLMTGMPGGLSEAITRQLERQMGAKEAAATSLSDADREPGMDTAPPEVNTVLPAFGLLKPGQLAPLRSPPAIDQNALASRMAAPSATPGATSPAISPLPAAHVTPLSRPAAPAAAVGKAAPPLTASQVNQAQFVQRHTTAANAASLETGVPASFMVAQAAHESGWGRREIKMPDGSNSFNVFGIKAGGQWTGKVAEVTTTEYINGQPRKVVAKFRAYDSYDAAFKDYARMLKTSPRYSQVVANASTAAGFAQGLQRAGYATDPAYADKLTRVINTTMRLQRMVT
ncbi:MAG: flagellar assembly peptidoglycan hydrolase FlgJ [Pseudomonadota bacterium]